VWGREYVRVVPLFKPVSRKSVVTVEVRTRAERWRFDWLTDELYTFSSDCSLLTRFDSPVRVKFLHWYDSGE